MRFALYFLALCVSFPAAAQPPPPAKATFESKTEGRKVSIRIKLTIDPGWCVFANPVGNELLEGGRLRVVLRDSDGVDQKIDVKFPKGETVKDKDVGDYQVYRDSVVIDAELTRNHDERPLYLSVRALPHNDNVPCPLPVGIVHKIP